MSDTSHGSGDALSRRDVLKAAASLAAAAALPGALDGCVSQGAPASPSPEPVVTRARRLPQVASPRRVIDYARAKATPTVCFGCTTQCHVLGWVQDGRVVRISGNPLDPNGHGRICAKANGLIHATTYPGRLLHPLRRAGPRGSGQWERISWDEALDTIAARLQGLIERERPDLFAIQVGRDKTFGLTERFLRTVGSPHGLNRRAICSSNVRLGYMTTFGQVMDWGAPDLERTRYVLNFGSNLMEAHQGGFGGIERLQAARLERGARLVTFEVRPSATASVSDEYWPVSPGSDGAIAMALAHVIAHEGLADRAFWDRWCNLPFEQLLAHLAPFTPELAARESGVPAEALRRIAREFAAAAPACTTLINRGIAKHLNGIHGARAAVLLDVLVGNVGQPGGASVVNRGPWSGEWGQWGLPKLEQPAPRPPAPPKWKPGLPCFDELPDAVKAAWERLPEPWKSRYQGELLTPVEYPLAWRWQGMKVGQMNYPWLREGRARLDTLFTYVFDGAYGYPEAKVCREVLLDERLVPFHVAIDIALSETSALADIVLPETTALERWDMQVTNAWDLVPLTGLRQPLVPPAGEARSVWWIYRELARRLGPARYAYWDFPDEEAFYRAWYAPLPLAWEELKRRGVWSPEGRDPDHRLFERPVPPEELDGAEVDERSGLIEKAGRRVGIMRAGQAVRGFPSDSGLIEVLQPAFTQAAAAVGLGEHPIANPLPTWFPVSAHQAMRAGDLKLVTFKWNVHTQGRTAHHKYQAEIVHTNPVWISPETGRRLGLRDGQRVRVSVRRPVGAVWGADPQALTGAFEQRVRFVRGVAPDTLAVSHHLGHWGHAPLGNGRVDERPAGSEGMDPVAMADRDLPGNVWWAAAHGGPGVGVAINDAFPLAPTPLSGGQLWFDCVARIEAL